MDLNRYNHSVLRHFGSVADYEATRLNYCDLLTREFSTVLEAYSNIANVPVKCQSIYVELSEPPSFVPRRILQDEAAEINEGRRKGKERELTAQELAEAQVLGLRTMSEVYDLLLAEPSDERTRGFHWSLPLQVCAHGKLQVDRDWLLKNAIYSLARRVGDRGPL